MTGDFVVRCTYAWMWCDQYNTGNKAVLQKESISTHTHTILPSTFIQFRTLRLFSFNIILSNESLPFMFCYWYDLNSIKVWNTFELLQTPSLTRTTKPETKPMMILWEHTLTHIMLYIIVFSTFSFNSTYKTDTDTTCLFSVFSHFTLPSLKLGRELKLNLNTESEFVVDYALLWISIWLLED